MFVILDSRQGLTTFLRATCVSAACAFRGASCDTPPTISAFQPGTSSTPTPNSWLPSCLLVT